MLQSTCSFVNFRWGCKVSLVSPRTITVDCSGNIVVVIEAVAVAVVVVGLSMKSFSNLEILVATYVEHF